MIYVTNAIKKCILTTIKSRYCVMKKNNSTALMISLSVLSLLQLSVRFCIWVVWKNGRIVAV